MNTQAIEESGMRFGPFPSDNVFYIEKSRCYQRIRTGVKMAEFLLLRNQSSGPVVWIVEAKSSSPRPETQPDFAGFIREIEEKFTNAFMLGMAAQLKRHPDAVEELSSAFQEPDLGRQDVRFVLVIRGYEKPRLVPIREALERAMRVVVRVWKLAPSSVLVLNEDMARQYGLMR